MMAGKRWTDEEIKLLKQMNENNITLKDMAERLGRSEYAVQNKLNFGLKVFLNNSTKNYDYLYKIGDEVNGMKIIKQIKDERGKGYIVQSVAYPDAPTYKIAETNLKNSKSCSYSSGLRIYEGNSLWSIESIRNNIIDMEQAKTTAPKSGKSLMFKCSTDGCQHTKKMYVSTLVNSGYYCPNCSRSTSYPELFMIAYFESKNIEYQAQVPFDDSRRRIDFYIPSLDVYVETHGLQHYEKIKSENNTWKDAHKKTVASDIAKRKWCKENGYTLIELDCSVSSFKFVRNSIKQCEYLESIKDDEVEKMLNIIEKNKRHPVNKIKEMYTVRKMSTVEIGEKLGLSSSTISRILNNQNEKLLGKRKVVKCLESGRIYTSITEASKSVKVHASAITMVCKGRRTYAGRNKSTDDLYTWEYLDTQEQYAIDQAKQCAEQPRMSIALDTDGSIFGNMFDTKQDQQLELNV